MEGKTNFSRHLKQFDSLTRVTPRTPTPYFTTDLRHWLGRKLSRGGGGDSCFQARPSSYTCAILLGGVTAVNYPQVQATSGPVWIPLLYLQNFSVI